MEDTLTCTPTTFSQVFGRQGQLMQATVQSLNSLNDQIAHFMVNRPNAMSHEEDTFLPNERDTLKQSMALMRHLLMDAQGKILKMMEDNKQLAQRIDGAIQSASQEVTNLRSELTATSRRLAELGACNPASLENNQQNHHHHHHHHHLHDPTVHHRQKTVVPDFTFQNAMSSLMDFGTPDSTLDKVLLREEVAQLQEEVHLLRQMKDMLSKDLEDSHGGCSADTLSAAELRVQLGEKEQELERAKEALQAMKGDRKRLKAEKADLVNQMQQLYTTLESREEQLRDFIRNYDQHRKESEDAVKALAKEKDLLEREKWDLRRQTKEATEQASSLRSQIDMKENRIKELEAELTMAKQSLATLTKDVPKRHSLAMPSEPVVNGSQEWVMQADLPLTAAIRQSQQTLYHAHPADRQAALRISPCHSRQPSIISDASAADGDRSSTPSDINSPRHRTHSLCNSMEDLEDQKRKKKKEKISLGSLSRVFARGKSQRKSLDPGLFDDSDSLSSQTHPGQSDGEEQLERLQQAELTRTKPMSLWKAVTVQAWLEVVMAMPMYIRACSENVKSGKVLLGLTDDDLELGLGVNSPMHRRKLRLAIEDYREAENGRGLSKAADMDHHWVSKSWLSDIGLPQYSQVFHNQLVDGRVLNSLTRRDLETIFNITNKFHVTSVLCAIQLLQMLNFDKETIQTRRSQCENRDLDPVVWTSHRVIKWIRDIDLKFSFFMQEYADSLQNSGIHGAVMVLDPTFSADSMAKALDIPNNKHMIHRHLYEEMKVLLNPARTNQAQDYRKEGTPTHSPVSNCRKTEEGFSPRQKTGKSPLRFNPMVGSGRDLSFQGCASPPREDRIKILQRTKGSPMHGYSSIEITNV
ncbi:kazrin, periplakin interacting protein b isoform X3 [Misgurnus anguillicaudatus]|uniref:kazrin, periplakin interacting protein b isoform X3 n=1 Tax=Misgurnus anguillicaudatus TaxID=75329 RepID=UPI003CCFA61D